MWKPAANLISFAKPVSGHPFPAKFLPEANSNGSYQALKKKMEVIMELQFNLPHSPESDVHVYTAAIQLAVTSLAEKSPSFHFPSSNGGCPMLSRNASRPCPR